MHIERLYSATYNSHWESIYARAYVSALHWYTTSDIYKSGKVKYVSHLACITYANLVQRSVWFEGPERVYHTLVGMFSWYICYWSPSFFWHHSFIKLKQIYRAIQPNCLSTLKCKWSAEFGLVFSQRPCFSSDSQNSAPSFGPCSFLHPFFVDAWWPSKHSFNHIFWFRWWAVRRTQSLISSYPNAWDTFHLTRKNPCNK